MILEDIALTLVPGLGPRGAAHLVETYGSAQEIYAAGAADLIDRGGLRRDLAEAVASKSTLKQAEREIQNMRRSGVEAVAATDGDYPPLLGECPDRPHVLYVEGCREVLGDRLLAMVGTRSVSPYGQRMCDMLVRQIAERFPEAVIVSGLAYGVDAACHRAALQYGLRTIGVVADPLPNVTPAAHRALAREIVERGGAVVSELHSQARVNGRRFVPRNRIIAGLCEGTVVVESDFNGGSMHTASMADGYFRTLMALPGRVGDPTSAGTNFLIKTQRARAVCGGGDILRELGWDLLPGARRPEPAAVQPPTLQEQALLDLMPQSEPVAIESLAGCGALSLPEVSALLLGMELSGLVEGRPGGKYVKR